MDERIPLFKMLKEALEEYPAWKDADDIAFRSERTESTTIIESLYDSAYRNLRNKEAVVEQMEEAHQMFLCYIASAEEACRQYGHLLAAMGSEEEETYRILYQEARATQELLRRRLPPV